MIKLRNLGWLFVTLVVAISINGTIFAQSAEQVREYKAGVYFYNDGVLNKCPGDGGATYTAAEIKNIQGKYKSGLTSPYILEQFMIGILKRMAQISGKPESDFVTQEHVLALVTFAIGEGGDIANSSLFNPMNGGMSPSWIGQSGSVWGGSGSDGRRGYDSFDTGVELYARQFFTGNQTRIGAVLGDPASTAQNFMYTLTYYSTYKGNLMWATASLPPNDKKYYQSRLALVEQVSKNYPAYGGIVIGTSALEQREGIYRKDLLTYKSMSVSSSATGSTTQAAAGSTCAASDATQPTNGDFVFYSQNDSKWGSDTYNGSGGSDIDSAGCGLTSYSMIAATFKKDTAITPKSLAKDSFTENVSIAGYRGETMAKWGSTKFGLPYERLANNKAAIRDALNAGAMVISGGGGGPYRFDSHIIVLRSIDSNDKVLVADPEDNSPKDRYYDLSDFISHGQYFVAVKNAK